LRYSPSALDPGSLFDRAVPFITYMFLHADWVHLAINCLWLLAFGSVVARRFRAALFLLFFLTCGISAALIHLVLNWESPAAVIGASGAISGLMAAGVRLLEVSGRRAPQDRPALLPILNPQVLAFTAFWVAVNLVFGLTGLSIGGETHAIAWEAHIGGYLVGLILAPPFDSLARRGASDLPEPA
jgi:membrane associated rhomboid family serine protease